MPIVQHDPIQSEFEARQRAGIPRQADFVASPTSFERWGAAFRQANLGAAAVRWIGRDRGFTPVAGYSPFDDPMVRDLAREYPEDFDAVFSPDEALAVQERVIQNRKDQEALASGGGVSGFVMAMTAGLLSPENLIPIGWLGRIAKAGELTADAARSAILAKYGRLADTAEEALIGVRFTKQERAAVSGGRVSMEDIRRARRVQRELTQDVLRRRGAVTPAEKELIDELASLRKNPTDKDYRELWLTEVESAKLGGRPIPDRPLSASGRETMEGVGKAQRSAAEQAALADARVVQAQESLETLRSEILAKGGAATAEETTLLAKLDDLAKRSPGKIGEPELRRFFRQEQEAAALAGRQIPNLQVPVPEEAVEATGKTVLPPAYPLSTNVGPEFRTISGTEDLVQNRPARPARGRVRDKKPIGDEKPSDLELRNFYESRRDFYTRRGEQGNPAEALELELRRPILDELEQVQAELNALRATRGADEVRAISEASSSVSKAIEEQRATIRAGKESVRQSVSQAASADRVDDVAAGRQLWADRNARWQEEVVSGRSQPPPRFPREERLLEQLGLSRDSRIGAPLPGPFSPVVRTATGRNLSLKQATKAEQARRSAARKIWEQRGREQALRRELAAFQKATGEDAVALAALGKKEILRRMSTLGLESAALGGTSELVLQATLEGRDEEVFASVVVASAALGFLFAGVGGIFQMQTNARFLATHDALVDDLLSPGGSVLDNLPEGVRLSPAEARSAKAAEILAERIAEYSPGYGGLLNQGPKAVGADTPVLKQAIEAALHLTPTGRLAKSTFEKSRAAVHLLTAAQFHKVGANPRVAVNSLIKVHFEDGLAAARKVEKLGKGSEFHSDVATVLRTGQKSTSEKVNQAAAVLEEHFDRKLRELKRLGLVEEVDLGLDAGYFPRLWNWAELERSPTEFIQNVSKFVGGEDKARKLHQELVRARNEAVDDPFDLLPKRYAKRGSALERTLKKIPSNAVSNYLYNDARYVLNSYSQMMGAQIEFARLYKDVTGHVGPLDEDQVRDAFELQYLRKEITKEAEAKIAKAKDDKKIEKLEATLARDLKDLSYTRDSYLSAFRRDPYAEGSRRVSGALSAATSIALLPKAGVWALVDTMASGLQFGVRRWFLTSWNKSTAPLRKLLGKYPKDELVAGVRDLEWAGDQFSRTGMFSNAHLQGGLSKPGGTATEKLQRGFFTANLLRPLTTLALDFAATGAQSEVLALARRGVPWEKLPRRKRMMLESMGIDESKLKVYAKLPVVEDNGRIFAKIDEWPETVAHEFRGAITQGSRRAVLSPEPANFPMWAHGEIGHHLLKFLHFPLESTQAYSLSILQRHDASAVVAASMMAATGVFVEGFKGIVNSREQEWGDMVLQGTLRSGIFGLGEYLNFYGSRTTGGMVDVANLFGLKTTYETVGGIDGLGDVVPGAAAFEKEMRNLNTVTRAMTGQEISEREWEMFLRRLPFVEAMGVAPAVQAVDGVFRGNQ